MQQRIAYIRHAYAAILENLFILSRWARLRSRSKHCAMIVRWRCCGCAKKRTYNNHKKKRTANGRARDAGGLHHVKHKRVASHKLDITAAHERPAAQRRRTTTRDAAARNAQYATNINEINPKSFLTAGPNVQSAFNFGRGPNKLRGRSRDRFCNAGALLFRQQHTFSSPPPHPLRPERVYLTIYRYALMEGAEHVLGGQHTTTYI